MFVNFNKIAMDRRFKGNFQNDIAGSASKGKRQLSPQQILELLQQKELRLSDNPKYISLANLASVLPEDAALQDILGMVINKQNILAMLGTATDPFYMNYPALGSTQSNPNGIICGFMPTGEAITLDPFRTSCNIGVLGRTGSSKTSWIVYVVRQLIRIGFLVVVFQQKTEYDDLATDTDLIGRVLPLRFEEFMISRFQNACGVPHKIHLDTHFNDFASSTGRIYAQILAQDIAEKEQKKLPEGLYPPLSRLVKAIEDFKTAYGDVSSHYRESSLYAFKSIQASFKNVYDFYYSDFLDKLYNHFPDGGLVTITIDAPVASSTDAILNTIRPIYSQRKYSGLLTNKFQPLIFIIEDGTMIIDEKSLHGAPSPLIPMSFISRKYGIGFIIVSHNIAASVSPLLLSNLESAIVFGISDEDPRRIQKLLGCSYEQAQTIQSFAPGSFAVRIPSFHGLPVFGRFPEEKPPRKLTEPERLNIVRTFLKSVKAIRYIDKALPAPEQSSISRKEIKNVYSLSPIEIKFLILAGTFRWFTKTQLYKACGLNRRTGKKVSDQLEKKGLIVTCCIGKLSFIKVILLGWTVLNEKGIEKPTARTNGEFEHELAAELIEARENSAGRSVTFEMDLFNKRLDVASHDRKTGQCRFFNIGVTDPIREAENLGIIANIPIVKSNENELIFVALDKSFASQVKKALKKKDRSGQLLKQVIIKTIADFVGA
jgi:hypothetical protein